MEIRVRTLRYPLLVTIALIIMGIGISALLWQAPRLTAKEQPTTKARPLLKTNAFPTAPPIGRPTLPVIDIVFHDESTVWDWHWDLSCEPKLEVYLGQQYPLQTVNITLVDDPTISLGVAYPDMGEAEAVGLASCEGTDGSLICRVAVGYGQASPALDLVTTVAPIYAIQEQLRERSPNLGSTTRVGLVGIYALDPTNGGWMAKSVRQYITRLIPLLWQRLWHRRLYQTAVALVLVLALLVGAAWLVTVQPELARDLGLVELGLVSQSTCAGLCQGCYCDSIINGTCYVGRRPSGCIGCVGACAGDNDCKCVPGLGGCGAQLAWCRSSDCAPRPETTPTTAEPTVTPPPLTCNEGGTYVHIEEPAASWFYEPDYPVAVHQDPQFRGFDIVIDAQGGWAEKRGFEKQQRCQSVSGKYPTDCPTDSWYWRCEEIVLEHYDDPLIKVALPMRLADSSVDWIEGYLDSRYYHAQRQEPLPKVFEIWAGEAMSVQTGLFKYPAEDPGVHGGKIILHTKGTPLNQPQRVALPYSVPVYLVDTTIKE